MVCLQHQTSTVGNTGCHVYSHGKFLESDLCSRHVKGEQCCRWRCGAKCGLRKGHYFIPSVVRKSIPSPLGRMVVFWWGSHPREAAKKPLFFRNIEDSKSRGRVMHVNVSFLDFASNSRLFVTVCTPLILSVCAHLWSAALNDWIYYAAAAAAGAIMSHLPFKSCFFLMHIRPVYLNIRKILTLHGPWPAKIGFSRRTCT